MSIGSRINTLRVLKKMSQTQLALKAGVSQTTISDYELENQKAHRIHILVKIAAALETTPAYLLDGSGEIDINDAPVSLSQLTTTYLQLTPAAQAMLLAIAKTMEKDN